jgi:hypothetical protein
MIMTASRNRRLLIIGVLAALFALGGGCLAYLATTSPGGSATGSNAANAGEPSTAATSDGSSPGSAGAPGAGSSGGGVDDTAPPRPGRNVPTTGIDLDGNGDTECFDVIITDQVQVPVRVVAAGVASTNGFIVADPGRCTDCVGARLGPNDSQSCRVGVRLSGNKPYPSEIGVTVTLTMDATCTDPNRKPCDDPRVAALSPAASNPVAVRVIGKLVRTVDVPEDESPDSPPVEGPDTPDQVDESSTPDTESVPEPGSPEPSS